MLYDTPDHQDIPSPVAGATKIDAEPDDLEDVLAARPARLQVVRGDVQLIPIGDSILYVRPIYVEATEGAVFPRFQFVAVTYGEHAVLADDSMTRPQPARRHDSSAEPRIDSATTGRDDHHDGPTTPTTTPTSRRRDGRPAARPGARPSSTPRTRR